MTFVNFEKFFLSTEYVLIKHWHFNDVLLFDSWRDHKLTLAVDLAIAMTSTPVGNQNPYWRICLQKSVGSCCYVLKQWESFHDVDQDYNEQDWDLSGYECPSWYQLAGAPSTGQGDALGSSVWEDCVWERTDAEANSRSCVVCIVIIILYHGIKHSFWISLPVMGYSCGCRAVLASLLDSKVKQAWALRQPKVLTI